MQLAALAVVAMVPLFGLLLVNAANDRTQALEAARTRMFDLALLAAARQSDPLQDVQELLLVLSGIPDVIEARPGACHSVMKTIKEQNPGLQSAGVIDADGNVVCRSVASAPPRNVRTTPGFQQASAAAPGVVTVGSVERSVATGQQMLVVTTRLPGTRADATGAAPFMLYATIGIGWMAQMAADFARSEQVSVTVWDSRSSTLLAAVPDQARLMGQDLPDRALVRHLAESPHGGIAVVPDLQGVPSIFGFAPMVLGDQVLAPPMVAVGVSQASVLATVNQRLRQDLGLALLALVLALGWALAMGERTQLRPIRALLRAARRLAAGDLDTKVTLRARDATEFRALGTALAEMAAGLKASRDALVDSEQLHRTLSHNATDMIHLYPLVAGVSYFCWGTQEVVGYPTEEMTPELLVSLLHPDEAASRTALVAELSAGRCEAMNAIVRVCHRSGRWLWLEVRYRLIRDPQTGSPRAILATSTDVSQRIEVEQTLRASETELRLLADNTSEVIVRVTEDYRRMYVSPASVELLGFTPEEMLQQGMTHGMHPDDQAGVMGALGALRQAGDVGTATYRRRHRDGHYVWLTTTGRRLAKGDGYVLVLRDTTRARLAEIAVEEQRGFFQALFDQTTDAQTAVRVEPDGRFVVEGVNAAACRMLGLPSELIIGRTPEQIWTAPRVAEIVRNLSEVLAQRQVLRLEDNTVIAGTTHREVMLVPILDAAGEVTQILMSSRDISHLKAAQAAAAQSMNWLLLAEQIAGVGHWRLTLPDWTLSWSAEVFRIYGLDPGAAQPTAEEVVGLYHGEDRERIVSLLEDTIAHRVKCEAALRLVRPDGQIRHVQTHGVPELGPDGEVIAVFGVVLDATEVVRNQQALAEARDAAEAANRVLAGLALRDALTGLANRRQFDETLDEQYRLALRDGTCLGLAMIDVDRFKQFNDRYGHLTGDDCLRSVSVAVRDCLLRPVDLAARYGGEEMAVVLPATDLAGAVAVAERICAAVHALGIPHAGSEHGVVTVSIGVAALVPLPELGPATMLVGLADRALYEAKSAGRDRVATMGATASRSLEVSH